MITRRRFLTCAGGGAAGLAFGTGYYTWRVEPHWLERVERPLAIANLPRSLVGCRLAQLSDVHIGPQVDDAYLIECFRRVREASPDIVVYTGDFVSYSADVVDHARTLFAHLPHGRLGTLGILGNHDYGPGWSRPDVAARVAGLAADAGVRILRNETADVGGLHVVGLDDWWANHLDLQTGLASLDDNRPALVLTHNPDTVDLPGWDAYRGWILAGHTHGGQCKPPFLPPPLLPVRNRRYTAGAFRLSGGRRLYINRGVGHLLSVRFNVRPEFTLFHLERA